MKRIDIAYALITNTDNEVLLVKNAGGTWSFPGGKRELEENLNSTIKRECLEEINVEVNVRGLVSVNEMVINNEQVMFFVFNADLKDTSSYCPDTSLSNLADKEIEAIEWVSISKADELMPWYENGVQALLNTTELKYFVNK